MHQIASVLARVVVSWGVRFNITKINKFISKEEVLFPIFRSRNQGKMETFGSDEEDDLWMYFLELEGKQN